MKKLALIMILVAGVFLICSPSHSWAGEKIRLAIASWNVPADPTTKVLKQIAADLEEATGGMVTSDISYQALGKPGDYYDALVGGLCDIAYFGPPYTPGRFPLSEGLMLPIAYPDIVTIGKAHYALWKKGFFDKSFSEVKVFAVGNTVDFLFMWPDKPVTTLSGFKKKKISAPGRIQSDMVEVTGAIPVSMPATELYTALDTGVLDGACQGWPWIPVFKAQEVVKYATEPNRSAWPIMIAINKDSYKKLPKEAKAVLDNNGEKYSLMQAQGFQNFAELGRKIFLKAGGKIDVLSKDDTAKMDKLFRPIFQEWIAKTKARGLPAEEFLDALYAVLEELGVNEPFAR